MCSSCLVEARVISRVVESIVEVPLGLLSDVENLQLERPPILKLAYRAKVGLGAGRGHTLGGMRVESARRVTKLILITAPSCQPN
jgi:hypothetical protein